MLDALARSVRAADTRTAASGGGWEPTDRYATRDPLYPITR